MDNDQTTDFYVVKTAEGGYLTFSKRVVNLGAAYWFTKQEAEKVAAKIEGARALHLADAYEELGM